jgi:hypothetical protein
MNPIIEFRARDTGMVLARMPLYDFLRVTHYHLPDSECFAFDDLEISLDGEELLPEPCGHA